jgi:Mg2+ and Co2+ transporter CorA
MEEESGESRELSRVEDVEDSLEDKRTSGSMILRIASVQRRLAALHRVYGREGSCEREH